MLGLGASISKNKKLKKPIIKDNLVLKHNYMRGGVHQVSTGAASFNGGSDYIQLPSAFSNASNKITVSAWVYNTGSGTEAIFENRNASLSSPSDAQRGVLFYVDSNQALKVKCQNVAISGTNGLSLNKWVHACFTYDSAAGSNELKLYENGILVATGSVSVAFNDTAWSNARIGRGNVTDYYFPGYICNVGIWDEVLTQPQVKSIMWKNYADLTAGETGDLVSWYNLDSVIDSTETVGVGSTAVYDNHHGGGDTLGAELVANGTFDSDLTGWTTANTDGNNTIVQADGKVVLTADGSTALNLRQSDTFVVGKTYKVSFDAYDITGGGLKIQSGNDANISPIQADGSYTIYHTATGVNLNIFRRTGSSACAGKLDNISVKLVNGNTGTLS